MYAVMWSEHCSYKSSRIHLRRLPSEGPDVLVGPGENAGVVDAGDGIGVAFRIESHNHPSAIEPYQGAATGIGGILRDVFTMGARPIALMDPLRFGPLSDARSRWIAEGVVSGISGYGNSVGVPTVGGETVFDETYQDNPLVNVFCLGVLPIERLVLGRASGVGNLAVLFGSTTGRDGIGGVSVLASAGFGDDEDDAAKRPSVQVGDPFEEKRLIEACLEMLDANLVVGIQDLGGAGLTCATSETASRGGVGMDVYVSEVAQREAGMEPFEVLTSESQERMLAIVEPGHLDAVLAICERWEIIASVVGTVTAGGRLRILDRVDGEVLADVPASSLHEDAPLLDRPRAEPADRAARSADSADTALPPPADPTADLLDLLYDTSWVFSQYDHQLFLNTVEGPGRRRHRPAPQASGHGRRHRPGARAHLRRQPPLVRPRPPAGHGAGRGRGRGQPGLRRGAAAGARQLPQLRQPRAPHHDVAAVRGDRRHGRGLPCAVGARGGRQRQPLQREPGPRHRPHAGGRHGRHDRPAGVAAPGRRARRGHAPRGPGRRPRHAVRVAMGLASGSQGGLTPRARSRRPPGGVRPRARPRGRRTGARREGHGRRRAGRGSGRDGGHQRRRGGGPSARGRGPPLGVRRDPQPVRRGGQPRSDRRGPPAPHRRGGCRGTGGRGRAATAWRSRAWPVAPTSTPRWPTWSPRGAAPSRPSSPTAPPRADHAS